MGICNTSNKNKNRAVRIKTIINNNPGRDKYVEERNKYQKEIKINPFFLLNSSVNQQKIVGQYENSNQNPSAFVSNLGQNKYTNVFKKQYETCYLKSEPILNNIYPNNQKESQLLFLNLSFFFLTNGGAIDRKFEWAQRLINEVYEGNQKMYDIGKLNDIIKNIINIGLIIVIYFGAIFIYLNEENKLKVFGEEIFRVEDKYLIGELDRYFLNKFENQEVNDEYFMEKWAEFIMSSVIKLDENNLLNYENYLIPLNDLQKEEIKCKFSHMCDPMCFFEVFLKYQVPDYDAKIYKNQLPVGFGKN